jgi:hypothetical protein
LRPWEYFYDATDGLVGWWKFDEVAGIVANDSSGPYSGFDDDGMLVGSTMFIPDATMGSVLKVYGVSGQVQYPATPNLQPAMGTISLWLKPASYRVSYVVRQQTDKLVQCNTSGIFDAFAIVIDVKGRVDAVVSNDTANDCAKEPWTYVYGNPKSVPLNQWTHVAIQWNGTMVTLFVNGQAKGSAAYAATPDTGLSYHGTSSLTVGKDFDGQISDLRMYSRALSETEIATIYNQQATTTKNSHGK